MRLSRTFATFIPSTYLSNIISGRCSEIQLPLYAWNVLHCTFSFIWSLYPNVFTYFLLPTQKKSVFTHVVTDHWRSVWFSQNASADAAALTFHTQTGSPVGCACMLEHASCFRTQQQQSDIRISPTYSVSWYEQHGAYLLSCLFVSSVANSFAEESDLGWCFSPMSTWDLSHALVTI